MPERTSVPVRIRGREFRVRTDGDEETLRRVAQHLDETLSRIEQRTGTVDSLDVALLGGLNLAREVVELRDTGPDAAAVPDGRLEALIDLAESALQPEG
jgi:cell division protein ZapA (FtsZ GTPase activity inhibitor)